MILYRDGINIRTPSDDRLERLFDKLNEAEGKITSVVGEFNGMKNTLSTKYKILFFCAVFTLFCWIILGFLAIYKGDVPGGIFDLFLILPVSLMFAVLKNPKLPLAVPIAVLGGFVATMLPVMTFPRLSVILGRESHTIAVIIFLSGFFSLGTGGWGSITAYHWINERLLATLPEQDQHHTIDTKEVKTMEINKESWDFITDLDAPDFAEKFENLIQAYVRNACSDKKRFPVREDVYFFRSVTSESNWLCKWPLPARSYFKSPTERELDRLSGFLYYYKAVGMRDDYEAIYGSDEEAYLHFIRAYRVLLDAHRAGYAGEQSKRKKETGDKTK